MTFRTIGLGGLLIASIGCAAPTGTAVDLPLISPPVRSATPAGLQTMARTVDHALDAALRASDVRERFFSGSGPTDLMTILGSIDERLSEVNMRMPSPCTDLAPVSYTITPAGHDVELFAQCYQHFIDAAPGDPAFMQFGQRDGKTALYVAIGAARLAALVTPIEGSTDHIVDAWYGVGYTNAAGCGTTHTFDDCSYAITELHANPATKAFEMSVAGIGVGFCGIQFASDGTLLHGIGSGDMGSTCNASATLCATASDLATSDMCTSTSYALPALGRRAGAGAHVFGASQYPATPNITLDGTDSDSLHFAPTAPTPGVGNFDAK
jgi:hypothetical protein